MGFEFIRLSLHLNLGRFDEFQVSYFQPKRVRNFFIRVKWFPDEYFIVIFNFAFVRIFFDCKLLPRFDNPQVERQREIQVRKDFIYAKAVKIIPPGIGIAVVFTAG